MVFGVPSGYYGVARTGKRGERMLWASDGGPFVAGAWGWAWAVGSGSGRAGLWGLFGSRGSLPWAWLLAMAKLLAKRRYNRRGQKAQIIAP